MIIIVIVDFVCDVIYWNFTPEDNAFWILILDNN